MVIFLIVPPLVEVSFRSRPSICGLDVALIDIEGNRTLQERNRENNARTITFTHEDPLYSREGTITDSYLTASFKIGVGVHAGFPAQTLPQILYFAIRHWRGFALETDESDHSRETQQIQPILRTDLNK